MVHQTGKPKTVASVLMRPPAGIVSPHVIAHSGVSATRKIQAFYNERGAQPLLDLSGDNVCGEIKKLIKTHIGTLRNGFGMPSSIQKHFIEAELSAKDSRYARTPGWPEPKQAFSDRIRIESGVDILPQDIFITTGASGGIKMLSYALFADNPGVAMIGPSPGYAAWFARIGKEVRGKGSKNAGYYPYVYKNDREIDLNSLEAALRTVHANGVYPTAMLFEYTNPRGTRVTVDNAQKALSLAIKYGVLLVIGDNAYTLIEKPGPWQSAIDVVNNTFDRDKARELGSKSFRISELTGGRIDVIEMESISKILGGCSKRIGALAFVPARERSHLDSIRNSIFSDLSDDLGVNSYQYAAAQALAHFDHLPDFNNAVEASRNAFVAAMKDVPGLSVKYAGSEYAAAFYVLVEVTPDVRGRIRAKFPTPTDFAKALAVEEQVIVCPADGFRPKTNAIISSYLSPKELDNYDLRILIAVKPDDLRDVAQRLDGFMKRHLA